MATDKPDIVTQEHLDYLDRLRESGVTNMFGAGEYIEQEFSLSTGAARTILKYWMKTFKGR
jgi:uncharacterized protein YciI